MGKNDEWDDWSGKISRNTRSDFGTGSDWDDFSGSTKKTEINRGRILDSDDFSNNRKKRKKKSGFGKGVLTGILIILIPVLLAAGILVAGLKFTNTSLALIPRGAFDVSTVTTKLSRLQSIVDSLFLFDYDQEDLEEGIYAGYINGLNDPYTVYYTEEEYTSMMESTQGTYYGIGVMISQEVNTGYTYVIRVFSGSPAEEAGLQEGDLIMEVAGEDAFSMDSSEIVSLIKGAEGTTVAIKVYRESTDKELVLDVERREVNVDTVYYHMMDDQIGYVELTEFDSVSTEQFTAAIEDLKNQGMKSLVLDLRDNPGGLLNVAVDIADVFIDTGVVVSMADKNGNSESYEADQEGALNLPVAVLVNGNSASAAEVLSGCIRDYEAGTIIGEQTYGKGIVQNVIPLGDGTALKLTVAHYYTPNGVDIHGTGIEPDTVVEADSSTEADEQLDAAVEYLMKEMK